MSRFRRSWTRGSSPRVTPEKAARLPFVNRLLRTVAERVSSHPRSFDAQGDNMTALSLSQAAGATGVAKITIAGALKSRWHAATRKQNGSYEIDTVVPAASERRVRSLLPWRRAAEAAGPTPSSGNSWPWPSSNWRTSRPHSMTCGRSETHGRRWHRRAYGRRPNRPRHDGRGCARPHDGGGSLSPRACQHADHSAKQFPLVLNRSAVIPGRGL